MLGNALSATVMAEARDGRVAGSVGTSLTPGFQRSVSVAVVVAVSVAKYVRITFIRKNSVRTP